MSRIPELIGQQANDLHRAATAAGQRPVIDVALDGTLVFTVSPGPGEKVFDDLIQTVQAFDDLAEIRRSPC